MRPLQKFFAQKEKEDRDSEGEYGLYYQVIFSGLIDIPFWFNIYYLRKKFIPFGPFKDISYIFWGLVNSYKFIFIDI